MGDYCPVCRSNEYTAIGKPRSNLISRKFINNVKFLDIGTGEGKTLIAGLERNWDVTGIDIVDNRIPEAKTDKINFYC
jgi:2-polyprenyl-3-methyl-5-hydroxy-6-metoxy-1,4-benzoquinol methylase